MKINEKNGPYDIILSIVLCTGMASLFVMLIYAVHSPTERGNIVEKTWTEEYNIHDSSRCRESNQRVPAKYTIRLHQEGYADTSYNITRERYYSLKLDDYVEDIATFLKEKTEKDKLVP